MPAHIEKQVLLHRKVGGTIFRAVRVTGFVSVRHGFLTLTSANHAEASVCGSPAPTSLAQRVMTCNTGHEQASLRMVPTGQKQELPASDDACTSTYLTPSKSVGSDKQRPKAPRQPEQVSDVCPRLVKCIRSLFQGTLCMLNIPSLPKEDVREWL